MSPATTKTTLSLKQTSGPLQLVHLDTGLLILESPRGPRDLRLSVRPGHYLVRRYLASETRVKEIDLRPDGTTTVREADLVAVSPGPLAAKSAGERDVSASIVPAGALELQAAAGVRHAPVIDPGLRLGEGGTGRRRHPARQLRHRRRLAIHGAARARAWCGRSVRVELGDVGGNADAGPGTDRRCGDDRVGARGRRLRSPARDRRTATFNASVTLLGAYSWTSREPDAAGASPAPGRRAFDTWSAQLTGGFTRFVSDAVSLSLGASVGHNLIETGDVAPWAGDDPRGGLVLGIGSIQRRGLRPLPLVRVYLGDRLTVDGHVAVAYLPATSKVVETYLAGVTSLF